MKLNFTLCNQDHFRYLQLRNFYDSEGKPSVNLDKNNLITALVGIYSSEISTYSESIQFHLLPSGAKARYSK